MASRSDASWLRRPPIESLLRDSLGALCASVAIFVVAFGAAVAFLRAQPSRPNVLLITIDTVRADHIGAYGYTKGSTPTLDRLAREGVRFADATSQAPLTGPSHAAILTGVYPGRLGVRDNATMAVPSSARTAAEIFKSAGYRTGGFIGAFIVDRQYGFGQGFDEFAARFDGFSSPDKLQARRRGAQVVDDALKWLAQKRSEPFFAWVHLYDAHAPYEPPAAYRTRFPKSPYDGAIAYVDAQVGRLVSALEQSGALDRTIVAVVADHGEGLGEHAEAEHGFFLYDSTLHVPWIVRLPGHQHAGTVVREQVRGIDVLPTLTAFAGLSTPPGIDGESVVPVVEGHARHEAPASYAETFYPKLHFGWSELRAVRTGDWKYVAAPKPELYDVKHDGAERQNLADARAPLAAGLQRETSRIESSFGPAAQTSAAPAPDAETLARLRSLGYVGTTAAAPSGGRGPDPKDMIAGLNAYHESMVRVTHALQTGNPAAAVAILKRELAKNDRAYEPHLFLGDAYYGLKQYRDALDEYTAARLLNPATAEPILAQARTHLALGDGEAASRDAAEAARLEPGSDETLAVSGMVLEQRGEAAEAIDRYSRAVAANPSNAQARARLAALAMRLGMYDRAGEQFAALLGMKYRPSRMHFGLGQIAQAKGDTAKAAAEYRLAISIEPTFEEARQALKRVQ
jgi:arylsulfatase A-like enzyme/Flp pilus assembly protein TadD